MTAETLQQKMPAAARTVRPPGRSWLANFVSLHRMLRGGAIDEFTQMFARSGELVDFSALGKNAFLISDPYVAHEILVDRHEEFPKSRSYHELALILGNGLVNSEGAFWRRQRKLAQPAFHRSRIAGFAQSMIQDVQDLVQSWKIIPVSQSMDVAVEMNKLTLAIVGHALFSTDVAEFAQTANAAMHFAVDFVNRRTIALLKIPLWWPTKKNRRFKQAMQSLNAIVEKIIQERRKNPGGTDDLLGLMMKARDDETGEGMTDSQLRDEVMTFVLAGHETTSNTLSWALYLLSCHPEVRTRLEEEVDTVLSDRVLKFADLPRLKYTRMVIEETMRLYPAAWLIERTPRVATRIKGFTAPKDTLLLICTYLIHRHPRYWPQPALFRPERFDPEATDVEGRHVAYLPFSLGPRQCIGNIFAMTEAQIILATIVQHFRLHLIPGHPIEPEPSVTLRPRYGVMVHLEQREKKPEVKNVL